MDNHYHLIVDCAQSDLSDGMQWLNGVYAQRFNERRGRYGHLFAARFSARAIVDERQLEQTLAYVLMNPVKAGICGDPDTYRWSAVMGPTRRKTPWTNVRSTARLAGDGCRRARRPRRPRAQPEGRHRQAAAERP